MHKITLLPGDGIGPDITAATKKILAATGVAIEWEEHLAGESAIPEFGTPLPETVLESIRRNKIALKGPLTTPVGSGFRSINVALRKELDLFANLRPARTYPGIRSRYEDIDLVVVRENTEDLYAGVEHMVGEDAAESIKIITRKGCERICHFAFEYAQKNNRRKVTAVHKANIMKCTDGLFLSVFNEVAKDYPDIEPEDRIVDNMCMQLVQKPELYDVMVMPNLYGDIVSDLCAGLVGGLGLAPGANIGKDYALFEPVHGSAPKYAGQDKVNPTALILSAVLMLRYINEEEAADRVEKALAAVIKEGKTVTYDLGGSAKGMEMAEAVVAKMG
ncbi:isocitrate/isopropylmalate dehydrogenase family protein [Dethiobacter alkaliphilus]|uniref:Isocitrate dehydrogenase (NAD(+)) n=1 Tax=Dethiobacter alkaliphilus AHT 1 TaxID=555088 RepID=C0GIS8_DETAL|nr:isocitrate/isopropylmalate dehydrogenase family protein [Dethiobacter alkaliphilus]EEG76742.1 Isocitrate dehydrogenase (NAD(+)) [Dethiobacter alkaliphilus AHT 1]